MRDVLREVLDFVRRYNKACEGKVIFLNGPSSSGKTSIARRLQEKLPEPFLHIGIDKLIGMMPAHLNDWEGGIVEEGFYWKKEYDSDGNEVYHIQMGPYAKKVNNSLKNIVLTMLNDGLNVIIDEVCIDSESFNRWQKKLSSYKVLYVGVRAPVETLETREKERDNRIHGSARAQHELVHLGNQYDLEVDTSMKSIEGCVNSIITQCCALPYFLY